MSIIRFRPQPKPNFTDQKIKKVRKEDAVWNGLKEAVYEIDGKQCYSGKYCISKMLGRPTSLTPSHINPRGRGGEDSQENVVPQCAACNRVRDTGTEAFGKRVTGDEFMLKVLKLHEKDAGFTHQKGIEYLKGIVGKQKLERDGYVKD